VTGDGRRIQVKARVVMDAKRRSNRQLSAIRSWGFDQLAVILFGPEYSVSRAVLLPVELARERSRRSSHVNADNLYATDELLDDPRAEDITSRLRSLVDSL
jgi:hypothetical protein